MTDEGGDFYSVLGVARNASTDTIRRAYRDRAKETHPDVAEGADASARFRRVKRAHEVLSDPTERARYDRLGHEGYLAAERLGTDSDPETETESPESTATSGADAASRTRRGRARGTTAAGRGRSGYGPRSGGRRRQASRSDDEDVGSVRMGAARWVRFTTALLETWQSRLTPSSGPLALAVFVAYPVFLGSTVAPWFPPSVNAIVGICTLFVVAYLVLRPELGIPVFGGWLALLPVALSVAGLGVVSLPGALAFLLTAVPLALCVSSLLAGTSL
jgi:hypothetical protein